MKTIAYSGVPNTGKTTELLDLNERLRKTNKGIFYFPEVARQLFDLLPNNNNTVRDMTLFQYAVRTREQERLFDIDEVQKNGIPDYVTIDRTYHDNVLFNNWNRGLGKSTLEDDEFKDFSGELYDTIILFTEPHKVSGHLTQYNNDLFDTMFCMGVADHYGRDCEVLVFKNNADPKYIDWKNSIIR